MFWSQSKINAGYNNPPGKAKQRTPLLGTTRHVTLHLGQQHFQHEAQGTICLTWARWAEARNRTKRGILGQGASDDASCISLAHKDSKQAWKKRDWQVCWAHYGLCWR